MYIIEQSKYKVIYQCNIEFIREVLQFNQLFVFMDKKKIISLYQNKKIYSIYIYIYIYIVNCNYLMPYTFLLNRENKYYLTFQYKINFLITTFPYKAFKEIFL